MFEPSETLRYRLTVEVETPDGVKSGYSVWEYTITDIKIGFTRTQTDYEGEAVAVDLPNGQTLFALTVSEGGFPEYPQSVINEWLKTYPGYERDSETTFLTAFPGWTTAGTRWVVPRTRDTGCVPSQHCNDSNYPMLVTFGDINDPASVKKVNPDDLASSFGAGYKLRSITVTATDEKVTTRIGEKLGWLKTHRGTLKPNPPKTMEDPSDPDLRLLDTGPFSTGLFQ